MLIGMENNMRDYQMEKEASQGEENISICRGYTKSYISIVIRNCKGIGR